MFSCSQQLLIYVLSKLLSQAVWRRRGRQRLYHIWAPCAHFRASNTHICFAPPQNHKTFVSHWLAKSMITLWTLTLTFELHWAIYTPFQLIELGNVLVQTWDDAQDPSPFLFTCTCRFPFPEKLWKGYISPNFWSKVQMSAWALDHPIFVLCLLTSTLKTKHVAMDPTSSWERSWCYITL